MKGQPRWARNAGFTLLELTIVVLVILVLFLAALNELLPLRARVERSEVLVTVGSMRRALGYEMARRVLEEPAGGPEALVGSNPVLWLATPPRNYVGELTGEAAAAVAPGSWYFDPAEGVLVYRVEHEDGFTGKDQRIRLRVALRFEDRDGDGRYQRGSDRVLGLDIEVLDAFVWAELTRQALAPAQAANTGGGDR